MQVLPELAKTAPIREVRKLQALQNKLAKRNGNDLPPGSNDYGKPQDRMDQAHLQSLDVGHQS